MSDFLIDDILKRLKPKPLDVKLSYSSFASLQCKLIESEIDKSLIGIVK